MTQTILVVEDNPITTKLVRFALETHGFVVIEATDGATALRAFATSKISLVLVDLVLPDTDGFELLTLLRLIPGAREVPILAFTGLTSLEVTSRISSVGFDDMITKPIEPSRLIQIVRGYLPPSDGAKPVVIANDKRKTIVIADDDAVQRKLVGVRLQRAGYDVVAAVGDGEAALERVRALRPHAIVSDVLMPRLDGFALCMAVRGDPSIAATPIVLITNSYLESEDRDVAIAAGANELLLRTPDLREVVTTLENTIGAGVAPPPVKFDASVEDARVRRMMLQLERQVALHAGASQHVTLLAAQLSVLSAISEAVANQRDIDQALRQALAACLDAGGISLGALYLLDGNTTRVQSFGSLDGWTSTAITEFFGDWPLLETSIRTQTLLAIPSEAAGPRGQAVLDTARVRSLVAVPLGYQGQPLGALVMVSRSAELHTDDRIAFVRAVGGQISLALALTQSYAAKDASERAAKSQATLLRSILESLADGVVAVNEQAESTHWNRAAEAILPLTPSRDDSWVGRGVFGADKVTPVPPEEFPLTKAMRGESVDRFELFVRRDPASEGAWFSVNARPLLDDSGAPRGGVAVFRDVTPEKAANAQLLVSDRMASLGTLAAGVAHEINNPLQSVLLNLEMAASDLNDVMRGAPAVNFGELPEVIREARDAAGRLRNIARDLKLFSRADEDASAQVDIERALESSIRLVMTEVRHRAKLVRSYTKIPPVFANESRLGQVFLNLLINAAQAIPEGRADRNEIRVATSTTPDGRVRVAITDTGIGMSPATLARIFTPFFTTKPVGVGTGLGLAICQQLVRGIGGEITVETAVGKGTTFFVTLPAMTGSAVVSRSTTTLPKLQPAPRRAHILVVDDDANITSTMSRALGTEHDVAVASDPHEALRRIEAGERFDVILCDLMMPNGTGMDLYNHLLQFAPDQAANIVFMTGGAFTPGAREFLDEVANARLEKPFSIPVLRTMINERLATT